MGLQGSVYAKDKSIELSYGRIHIDFNAHDTSIIRNKSFIDSIFNIAERNFQEIESMLGYKSSLQFTATIHTELHSYHKDLSKNNVWNERVTGSVNYSQEYNYPIFVNAGFDQIESQFIYAISHFICHEFLLGISVRQKLSQTGFHKIPNWFLQGLGSYLATGWNANSADEYAFYESKGGFESPNQIIPMGAQVYGKKIWRDLFKTYGKSVVSTMMFVLKYTGNAESAFEYVTGKSFHEWNQERTTANANEKNKASGTEVQLSKKYGKIPILRMAKQGNLNAIQWYSPGLVKISIHNGVPNQMIELVNYEYPSLTNELDYSPIKLVDFFSFQQSKKTVTVLAIESNCQENRNVILVDSSGKVLDLVQLNPENVFSVQSKIMIENCEKTLTSSAFNCLSVKSYLLNTAVKLPLLFTSVGWRCGENVVITYRYQVDVSSDNIALRGSQLLKHLLHQKLNSLIAGDRSTNIENPNRIVQSRILKLPNERLDVAYAEKDSIGYAIDIQNAEKGQWLLVFKRLSPLGERTLRVDTVNEKPIVRGLVIEGPGQISYVQNEGEVWRLRFFHFKDNSDYRWQSEVKNSFYNQSKESGSSSIVEFSFGSSKSSVRFLDPTVETVRELELLTKSDGISIKNNLDLLQKPEDKTAKNDTVNDTWEYLVPFPRRSWSSLINNEKTPHYSGKYDSAEYLNTYYLSHGGLYFSNAEYAQLGYLNEIKPQLLYNQPFTPEMRFYLADKNHTYRLSFGLLSNIGLNRLGMRMQQEFKLGKFNIEQQLISRNRSFYLNEMSLKKNATKFFGVSIRRTWIPNCNFSLGFQYSEDSYFDKAVNPGFSSFKNYQFRNSGMVFGLEWKKPEKSIHVERSWRIHVKSSIKISQTSTPTIIPNRVYLSQNNLGNSYLFNLSINVDKQLINGFHFQSHLNANKSAGNILSLYWVGGSEGWISKDMWKTDISSEFVNNKYLYRLNGGYVRGFQSGERIGTGSFSIQNEIQWTPMKQINRDIIKKHFYETLMIYGFLDIGTAFIGNSPANPSNPFNTVTISTPNYWMTVTSKRNPYLIGTGLGVSANVLRTPIRYELAFGLKEGKFLSPIQQVCMSWFF
ncbi:MAG: hypothetical protein ACO3AQ_05585 [Bacteroidia bacterium]